MKQNIFIIFLLIFNFSKASAQQLLKNIPKGFDICISSSFDYTNRFFEGYDDYASKLLINRDYRYRTYVLGYSLNLQIQKPLSNRLYIIQGISMAKCGEHTPVMKGWIAGNPVLSNTDTSEFSPMNFGVSYNYEYYFLQFPAMISYHFGNNPRSTFFVFGGLSPDILFKEKTTIFVHNYKTSKVTKPETLTNLKFRFLYLNGVGGCGWKKMITEKLGFQVAAEFKYFFISPHSPDKMVSDTQMGKLFSAGLNLGVCF